MFGIPLGEADLDVLGELVEGFIVEVDERVVGGEFFEDLDEVGGDGGHELGESLWGVHFLLLKLAYVV